MSSHALVLGGGIAGLFTAQVLGAHFGRVTLIERDPLQLPDEPVTRAGASQGVHVHGLLTRGLQVSEQLMPGIADELRKHGAVPIDMGENAVRNHIGWSKRFASGMHVLSMSRSLFEWAVRQRVRAHVRIEMLDGHRVEALLGDRTRVTGVRVRSESDHSTAELPADLVVDATGRGSQALRWLEALGCHRPAEHVVDAHIGYATRLYRIPAGHAESWQVAYVQLGGPHQTRGGLLAPIEGGRWQVTLTGVGADRPPADDSAFVPFARTLSSPIIADAITGAEPLSAVVGSHATSNRRRYFERHPVPDGFVAIGDAVCAFNPVYGQGMTTGALGAVVLGECIDAQRGEVTGLARRFYRRLAKVNDVCWHMTTAADSRFPTTDGRTPGKLVAGFLDRLILAANHDSRVQDALLRVFTLQRGPATLLNPSLVARVLRSGRHSATPVPDLPPPIEFDLAVKGCS